MIDLTRTTTQLLEGLFDSQNAGAWSEFDRRYRPILVGFARSLGLSEFDAADAAQETLAQFVRDYQAGKYDRTRGRLRSWLIGSTRHRVADLRRKAASRRETGPEPSEVDFPDESRMEEIWRAEQQRVILRQAVNDFKNETKSADKTVQAFELLVFQGKSPGDVAQILDMKPQDVYLAKNRVTQRLRSIVQRLEAAYSEDE